MKLFSKNVPMKLFSFICLNLSIMVLCYCVHDEHMSTSFKKKHYNIVNYCWIFLIKYFMEFFNGGRPTSWILKIFIFGHVTDWGFFCVPNSEVFSSYMYFLTKESISYINASITEAVIGQATTTCGRTMATGRIVVSGFVTSTWKNITVIQHHNNSLTTTPFRHHGPQKLTAICRNMLSYPSYKPWMALNSLLVLMCR